MINTNIIENDMNHLKLIETEGHNRKVIGFLNI